MLETAPPLALQRLVLVPIEERFERGHRSLEATQPARALPRLTLRLRLDARALRGEHRVHGLAVLVPEVEAAEVQERRPREPVVHELDEGRLILALLEQH